MVEPGGTVSSKVGALELMPGALHHPPGLDSILCQGPGPSAYGASADQVQHQHREHWTARVMVPPSHVCETPD